MMRRDWVLALLAVVVFSLGGGWYVLDSRRLDPDPYVVSVSPVALSADIGTLRAPGTGTPHARALRGVRHLGRCVRLLAALQRRHPGGDDR